MITKRNTQNEILLPHRDFELFLNYIEAFRKTPEIYPSCEKNGKIETAPAILK